jgi:hypothetical protein
LIHSDHVGTTAELWTLRRNAKKEKRNRRIEGKMGEEGRCV